MAKNSKQLEFDFMKEEKKEENRSFKIGGYTVIYNHNIYNSTWGSATSNATSGASYVSNSSTWGSATSNATSGASYVSNSPTGGTYYGV
jgi:hypothetical protein